MASRLDRESNAIIARKRKELEEIKKERVQLEKLLTRGSEGAQDVVSQSEKWINDADILDKLNKAKHLSKELFNNYGSEETKQKAVHHLSQSPSVGDRDYKPKLVDGILEKRVKEYSRKQEQHISNIRLLNEERQKIINERYKLEERKRLFGRGESILSNRSQALSEPDDLYRQQRSYSGLSIASAYSVQDVDSLVQKTAKTMGKQLEKYWRHREEYERRQRRLYLPYNGELGIDSYHSWQLPDYHLVRSIVVEVVDRFLDAHFPYQKGDINDNTTRALRDMDIQSLAKAKTVATEQKAIQLISEGLILEVTGKMVFEVGQEFILIQSMAKSMTDVSLLRVIEEISTGKKGGRMSDNSKYDQVSKIYFHGQQERNKRRRDTWKHTQSTDAGPERPDWRQSNDD